MGSAAKEAIVKYKVVMNHENQFSIWHDDHDIPIGWRDVGITGVKKDCLSYIKQVWSDMRPLDFRKQKETTSCGGNNSSSDYFNDTCVHHLFENQVKKSPDALAVIFEDQQLTYLELNRRANQLANFLRKMNIGPDIKVGICIDRSVEMVIGIIGILKAGGTFMPIDPLYPKDRLSFMLQETNVPVVLSQEHLLKQVNFHDANVICMDTDLSEIHQLNCENPHSKVSSANLAYVIYTSGSTGKPKCVMIRHISLYNYVQDIQTPLGINSNDVYLHTASTSFSASVRQLMVPLSNGATVAITTSEQRKNPLALFKFIKRNDVTIMDIVPSFLRSCVQSLSELNDHEQLVFLNNKIRLILTTGEPLSTEDIKSWRFNLKHKAHFVNLYGATETSGSIAVYPVNTKNDNNKQIIPIGKAIGNTKIHLLDQELKPVRSGVTGEIYVSGLRLALGYFNRPELTAKSFIPDPYSDKPGSILWKTGDLARYLPDGNIQFSGRIDYQINIRGFRVEPGEVETVLIGHPDILQAVVTAKEDASGKEQIVAYLICKAGLLSGSDDFYNFLTDKVPHYMIPSVFVILDVFPKTPSGKVDRNALPAPTQKRPLLTQRYVAPRGQLERFLSKLWCQILKIDQVGIHDKFFELGGNSLLAASFVNSLHIELGISINITSVFSEPSISEYAAFLKKHYAQVLENKLSTEEILMDESHEDENESRDIDIEDIKSAVLKSHRTLSNRQRKLRLAHRKSHPISDS